MPADRLDALLPDRLVAPTPFLLAPGVYRLGALRSDVADPAEGYVRVDLVATPGGPFLRETWMLTHVFSTSFVLQPLPKLAKAPADELRALLPRHAFFAEWVHDPQSTAVPATLPPPVGPKQVVEGSWEIWSGPRTGLGGGTSFRPVQVGRIYVPPAHGLRRTEVWASYNPPPLTPMSPGELRFLKVDDGVDDLASLRAWYPANVSPREALWSFQYANL